MHTPNSLLGSMTNITKQQLFILKNLSQGLKGKVVFDGISPNSLFIQAKDDDHLNTIVSGIYTLAKALLKTTLCLTPDSSRQWSVLELPNKFMVHVITEQAIVNYDFEEVYGSIINRP